MADTTQAKLETATRLAASGNYAQANAMLDTIEAHETSVPVLLLRAKIQAQQGQFEEASSSFEQVLKLDPANQEATQGLALARQLQGNPAGRFYLRANLHFAGLYLVIAVLVGLLVYVATRAGTAPDAALELAITRMQENQLALGKQMIEGINAAQVSADRRNQQLVEMLQNRLIALESQLGELRRGYQAIGDYHTSIIKDVDELNNSLEGLKKAFVEAQADNQKAWDTFLKQTATRHQATLQRLDRLAKRPAAGGR